MDVSNPTNGDRIADIERLVICVVTAGQEERPGPLRRRGLSRQYRSTLRI
jgi:hypothetical protein